MSLRDFFRRFDLNKNFEVLSHTHKDLEFEINFSPNTLEINDIISLMNEDLGYELSYWGMGKRIEISKAKKKILGMKNDKFFYSGQFFYDKNNLERLIVSKVFPYVQPGVVRVIWIGEAEKFRIDSFSRLLQHRGFYSAYLFWKIDEDYQNIDRVEFFKSRNLPYDKSKVYTTEWGYEGLPIDGNPGRHRQVCNMFLRSCYRMWFSENSYELISKEKLESFNGGTINTQIFDKVRFIELYEDPFLSYIKENRERQKNFNEWIDIEGIYQYCLSNFGTKIYVDKNPPKLGRLE